MLKTVVLLKVFLENMIIFKKQHLCEFRFCYIWSNASLPNKNISFFNKKNPIEPKLLKDR